MSCEIKHQMVQINEINLHVVTAGTGYPLFLIHGFPQTWYVWRKLIPLLSSRFHIIALDLRGMGDSSVANKGQDKKTLASDIKGLFNYFNIKKAIVAGHDWGGAVAQRFALDFPENTEFLISMGIPYMASAKIEELTRTDQIFNNWYFFFHQVPTLPEKLVENAGKDYFNWMINKSYGSKGNPFTEEDIDIYLRSLSNPQKSTAPFNLYRTLFSIDAHDWEQHRNKIVETPTIWIRGEKDPFVPPRMSANVKKEFKTIFIEEIKGCGHWIPEEAPESVAEIFIKYLVDNHGKL